VIEAGRFFVPGPTEVRREILDAMRRPVIFHRNRDMEELMRRSTARLSAMFGTRRPVHVITGSGTSAMELAIRNGSVQRVLAVINGDFGARFAKMAEACGRSVELLTAEPGDAVPAERVRETLASGGFDTVLATHNETATGVIADIAAIARVVRESSDAMLLVDAVSGAGSTPISMDAWGVDAYVAASQKALALPPGLAFAAVSERFLERARTLKDRGVYLDVLRYEEFTAKHQSPTTPAVSLLFALDQQMADIERETLAARYARHTAMMKVSTEWVTALEQKGLPVALLPRRPELYSPSVTCIRSDKSPAILQTMRECGFELGGGQPPLAKSTFRIGHMGDHTVGGVERMLEALGQVLRSL
jgi:aspartate aminotransferase-like enzyme